MILIYSQEPAEIYSNHRSVDSTPITNPPRTPKLDPHQSQETKVKKLLCTRIEKKKILMPKSSTT